MANIPQELKYTKSHEWVRELDGGEVEVGLTDHAQDALGDLVFINLPEEGGEAVCGETIADVESVKAVSDVYSPVSGTVAAVNGALLDSPQSVNESPYEAWMFRVSGVTEREELLSAAEYEAFLKEEE